MLKTQSQMHTVSFFTGSRHGTDVKTQCFLDFTSLAELKSLPWRRSSKFEIEPLHSLEHLSLAAVSFHNIGMETVRTLRQSFLEDIMN